MTILTLILAVCSAPAQFSPPGEGCLAGIVVNGSDDRSPLAGTEVVLRVDVDGQLVIVGETTSDARGRFHFAPLPLDADFEYLAGANRGGVHYPGQRIRLSRQRSHVDVELVVYDSVTEPSPLVARRHEIVVRPATGALEVTETILVDNPTAASYVGRPVSTGAEPVTLRLAIPPDFERVTFQREFFGRRFSRTGGSLVTGVPWPPGRRKLKFSYLLRNDERHRIWKRPLDLPCKDVRLCVVTDEPNEIACNLGRRAGERPGEVVFECDDRALPAGYVVRLEMGRLPVSWMVFGRWIALALLLALTGGAGLATILRGRRSGSRAQAKTAPPGSGSSRRSVSRRHSRVSGHRRKRRVSAPRLR